MAAIFYGDLLRYLLWGFFSEIFIVNAIGVPFFW